MADQIILKVSFIITKTDIDERALFDQMNCQLNKIDKIRYDQPNHPNKLTDVVIEEIFVVGFKTMNKEDELMNKATDDNYNFDRMENNEITNTTTIMKELRNKYVQRVGEMKKFNEAMDKETAEFYSPLHSMGPIY